jgi:hypothetical protein
LPFAQSEVWQTPAAFRVFRLAFLILVGSLMNSSRVSES